MPNFSDFVADAEQESNIPGIRRMWKVLSKNFLSEFPTKASVVNGEITQNALAALPDLFMPAQYEVVINTIQANDNMDGDQGFMDFQQSIGFNTAGLNAAIKTELMKDFNAKEVYFFEDTDGQILVAGTSNKGLVAKVAGSTGQGGVNNDRRGNTVAAEGRGFRWPILPLNSTAKNDFLARLNGYGPFFQHNEFGFYTEFYVNSNYTIELRDSLGVKKDSVAYKPGDTVILTYAFPLNSTPHKPTSMFVGWVRASILSVDVNNVFTVRVNEKALNGFSTTRVSINKNSIKYTGLTSGTTPTHNQAPGPWVLAYTGGTLPYVANDYLFFWYTTGNGILVRVAAQFVSQVGTVVNVNLLSAASQNFNPPPAATGGWSVMKDTDYI